MLVCTHFFPEFIALNTSFNYSAYLMSSIGCSLLAQKTPRSPCFVSRTLYRERSRHKKSIRATLSIYTRREPHLESKPEKSVAFLVLWTCCWDQTSFALFKPHLSAITSGQITPNRQSYLKHSNNIFASFLMSESFFSASLLLGLLKIC